MRFKIKSKLPTFKSFAKNYRDAQMRALRVAVSVLVDHAAARVPVQTGMAKSSWAPLARELGISLRINPTETRPDKTPQMGEQQSDFKFTPTENGAIFTWHSDVKHYFLNEQFRMSKVRSSPWHSRQYGIAKMRAALRKAAREDILLALKSSISVTTRTST